jgi:hypothetical protein
MQMLDWDLSFDCPSKIPATPRAAARRYTPRRLAYEIRKTWAVSSFFALFFALCSKGSSVGHDTSTIVIAALKHG